MLTVKELRAAVGLSRERLEDAYEFLLANPPLGLAVQRHADELRLVTAPEVTASVERHLNHPEAVALSRAALEVLAIVAYRQPIAALGHRVHSRLGQRQRARHAAAAGVDRAQPAPSAGDDAGISRAAWGSET